MLLWWNEVTRKGGVEGCWWKVKWENVTMWLVTSFFFLATGFEVMILWEYSVRGVREKCEWGEGRLCESLKGEVQDEVLLV